MQKMMIKKSSSIVQFMELLSSLTKSGFTISRALKALEENPLTEVMAGKALDMIAEGCNVSSALCSLSVRLKGFEILLDTAEETGDIESLLEEICEQLKQSEESRKSLVAALVYPVFICLLALCLSLFLTVYGIPYINLIADVKKEELVKAVIRANLWLIFSSAVLVVVLCFLMHRRDFESRLFLSLYSLSESGVGMEEAFQVLLKERGFSKRDLKCISFILQGIREGRTLYENVLQSRRFDAFCISWLSAAEAGGDVKGVLKTVSEHYKKERKEAEELAVRFMEPALSGLCGIYVLILISGLVIPIFMSLGANIL